VRGAGGTVLEARDLGSFDEFLARRFPESRRKAYYLMSIHEHLPPQARKDLKEIGWTKGRELAKVARRDGQDFDCAPWVHKARSMPREDFRREVEKELTGKETEPSELIYFKVYKSQVPVIEQAIETAALMLGTDKSRRLLSGDDLRRLHRGRTPGQRQPGGPAQLHLPLLQVLARRTAAGLPRDPAGEGILSTIGPKSPRCGWTLCPTKRLSQQILRRDNWRCQSCGALSNLEVHHREFRSHSGRDSEENLITLCTTCHARAHCR